MLRVSTQRMMDGMLGAALAGAARGGRPQVHRSGAGKVDQDQGRGECLVRATLSSGAEGGIDRTKCDRWCWELDI